MILNIGTAKPTQAHGGVIIDGGFTEKYEWIAMASPYPVTPGETVVTILVYDVKTYAPMNGLSASLYLAPPGSGEPCCQGDGVLGPLPLLVDPVLYPGDYSNIMLLLRQGKWLGKFIIDEPEGPVDIFFSVEVKAANTNESRPTPEQAVQIAQTATAVADEIASGVVTPTAISQSPLASSRAAEIPQISPLDAPAETAYPAPAIIATTEADSVSDQVAQNEPTAPTDAEPSSQATDRSLEEPPWVMQNIFLVVALALIPVLGVVLWFLVSKNEEE